VDPTPQGRSDGPPAAQSAPGLTLSPGRRFEGHKEWRRYSVSLLPKPARPSGTEDPQPRIFRTIDPNLEKILD